ncbi:DUF1292 domain-containing protein [Ruminococcus sp. Marseille-P6503]|uniref:DUF1292 domain-containing protein n=1 Tax=Ruminococcus sp. Marseille-P6503 TaxID=2364796 RepID=UPI000F51C97E|nr:DUF1292 domain-containing protein [Ruminococcus sp. Marseille-P6503]
MSEEYTPDLYTLEDEDGHEQVFEMLDAMEYEGEKYYALTPYYENPEETLGDDGEVVILKSDFDGDEEIMVSIDDDEEYERIGNIFMKRIEEMFEFDDDEDDDAGSSTYS